MNNKPTKLRETSGYDELKTQAIDRFRSQDPMTLSNSELRSAIDYMLAYRWALEGDEDVLHEYIEASKIRNEDRHPSQNDLPPIDKFHPDWWYYRQEMEEPFEIDNSYKNESRYMNKKLIRLTESDLHRIVKQSVNKMLKESSYDSMGNFNKESNNSDVRERLTDEITKISQEMSRSMSTIDGVAKRAVGDEEITNRARIVINALMDACRKMRNVTQLIDANRCDLPA